MVVVWPLTVVLRLESVEAWFDVVVLRLLMLDVLLPTLVFRVEIDVA